MKTIMKSNSFNIAGMFMALLILTAVAGVPFAAHAQEDDGTTYDGGCCGSTDYGYTDYTPTGTDYGYTDYTPSTSDYGYTDYTPTDQYSNYSSTSFGLGLGLSAGIGGYGIGGYSSGYSYPSYSYPSYSPSVSNTNVNNNSCTGNSCNTVITSPTITYPSTPTVVYAAPVQTYIPPTPVYTTTTTYRNPVVAVNTPYVTLSQVPYTGLDLGPWGTAVYWGFLVLWCLFAAYLIVVKRVQNKLASMVKGFLFGTADVQTEVHTVVVAETHGHDSHVSHVVAPAHVAEAHVDAIDSFIVTQINRPSHA